MDIAIKIISYFMLVNIVGAILTNPFDIGKEREPYTAQSYVIGVMLYGLLIVIVGRALTWW